jgi:Putative phage tail protein
VKITFTDRAQNWQQNVSPPAQGTANIVVVGTLNSETIDFKGISNMTTATLVVARVLKTLSYPLAKMTIKANRSAWKYRPGGCFRFTWTPLGIVDQVFRVAKIGFGKIDDGTITLDAVEDIFGLSTVAFAPPPSSGWIDPVGAPTPLLAATAFEAPYQLLSTTEVRFLAGGVRAEGHTMGFEVWTDDGGQYRDVKPFSFFCPSGLLAANYSRTSPALDPAGITLQAGGNDLGLLDGTDATGRARGDCVLLFADTGELAAFDKVTANADRTTTFSNVVQGIYDTLPADHATGIRVLAMTVCDKCQQSPDPFRELVWGSNEADHQISVGSEVIEMTRLHQHSRLAQQRYSKAFVGACHRNSQYHVPPALDLQPAREFLRSQL